MSGAISQPAGSEGRTVDGAASQPQEITQSIQEEARRLLQGDKVDVVIGYSEAWDEEVASPCFVTDESQVGKLLFNEHCYHNLARYLVGCEGYLTSRFRTDEEAPRVALVATPATLRTVVGLIQEHQFERDDLVVLGIVDGTPVGIEPDVTVGRIEVDREEEKRVAGELQRLEMMSVSERWDWWEEQFSKCIRCYACRQVCPFCYCEQCIAEENQPQWIDRSSSAQNNRSFHIIRASHLIGRCTNCGACDRACPMNIPLSVLYGKLAAEVQRAFGYVAGTDVAATPALVDFLASEGGER